MTESTVSPTARRVSAAGHLIERQLQLMDALRNRGWTVVEGNLCTLTPPSGSRLVGADLLLAAQDSVTGGRIRVNIGDAVVEVRPAGSELTSEHLSGDLETAAAGELLGVLRSAADGDVSAALSLPGKWSGELTVDLVGALTLADERVSWIFCVSPAALLDRVRSLPFWELPAVLRPEQRPTVVACRLVDDPAVPQLYRAPALLVTSLHELLIHPEIYEDLALDPGSSSAGASKGLVATEQAQFPELHAALRSRCAGLAFASLANAEAVNVGGLQDTLMFQGTRQRRFEVPAEGWLDDPAAMLHLASWVSEADSPDRLLAVQQTAAGYTTDELRQPGALGEIEASADTVERILRADAVGSAVELLRDAQRSAVQAATASSEAALASARSVAERGLASLAATGGVVVAQSASRLPVDVARHLVVAIACYLAFLAVWSVLVEGPSVTAPLRAFRGDLPVTAQLLGDAQRCTVLELEAVRLAWRRCRTVRLTVPGIYAVAALVLAGLVIRSLAAVLHLPLLLPA